MGKQNSKLKSDDLDELRKCTGYTDTELQKWHTTFLNEHPSGKIRVNQFISIYQKLFLGGSASSFAEHVFRTFDTTGDGTLDFKEFITSCTVLMHGTPNSKLTWAFSMYDRDNNGFITRHEMIEIVSVNICLLYPQFYYNAFITLAVCFIHDELRRSKVRKYQWQNK